MENSSQLKLRNNEIVEKMNNIGINLDNIKVAIFDFDDTLAINEDKEFLNHRSKNEETYLNYYLNVYLKPEIFY